MRDKRFYFPEDAFCLEEEYIEDKIEEQIYRHDELGVLSVLMNNIYDSFVAETEEVKELNKEINALCNYIYKIENYIEANSEDILDLRADYNVDVILGD